jgi:hypothetical protein
LVECTLSVKQRRVTAFDLDQIVDQQHLDDPPNVDCPDRVLAQYKREKGEMPRMLRSVFVPGCIGDPAAAHNCFESICLNQKT